MQGKKPTVEQKKILGECGYHVQDWLVIKQPPGELHVRNKNTGEVSVIKLA